MASCGQSRCRPSTESFVGRATGMTRPWNLNLAKRNHWCRRMLYTQDIQTHQTELWASYDYSKPVRRLVVRRKLFMKSPNLPASFGDTANTLGRCLKGKKWDVHRLLPSGGSWFRPTINRKAAPVYPVSQTAGSFFHQLPLAQLDSLRHQSADLQSGEPTAAG